VTPVGWILNRFSSDLYTVDDSLPFILNIFLARLFGVFGVLIVCIYSVPWIVLLLVPLAFIYFDIQKKYRPASRDLKRVASVALSPIYAHFSETLNGLATIRAMKESERFVAQNEDRVERSQKSQYAGVAAAQWLQLRLQMIGVTVVAGISVIAVLQHHGSVIYGSSSVNPGYLGLALSYALGVTSFLADVVSMGTEAEKELVAVERCSQYLDNVPRETSDNIEDESALDDWPSEGIVSFKDVCFRYRENLPLVLQVGFNTREKLVQ
jgi:ATP-binding cassette subfamily C (CFTR/MRP) protein 10